MEIDIDKIDYSKLTEDDLHGLRIDAADELGRRKKEQKMPVYFVDGCYYKSIIEALENLTREIEVARKHKYGPEKYFEDSTDWLMGIKKEYWSKSEYDARPDRVYSC